MDGKDSTALLIRSGDVQYLLPILQPGTLFVMVQIPTMTLFCELYVIYG